MSSHKKFFTVKEAIVLLPKLNFMVEKVRTLKTEIAFQISELGPALSKAKINGRSKKGRGVYLCWRLGEDRVNFWHDLDASFNGRKPI